MDAGHCRGTLRIHGRDQANATGGATWVVREHRIEYLLPAFAGEEIEIKTWAENIPRVRSLRNYEFIRIVDKKLWSKVKWIGSL